MAKSDIETKRARKTISRDSMTVSPWQQYSSGHPQAPAIIEHPLYDALIIGGGITGITTALLLQLAGRKCILAEAQNLGFGTTGGTSAHLNTFFDSTYPEIQRNFGEEAARMVADSGKEAFKMITDLISKFSIDCDFEYKDACLFSETEKETEELAAIVDSSEKAGIPLIEVSEINVPVPFRKAYKFKDQGQFHPLKYIAALANEFVKAGGTILENTFIKDTKKVDGTHFAEAENLVLKSKNVVYATHIPPGITLLSFRCAPYRSYVLGVSLKDGNYPDGLAYDMQEPYHYFRTHKIAGKKYLLIGGEDHKTGHGDPEKAFKELEKYCRKYYNVSSVAYKWSAQYYVPSDGLPYIGTLPGADKTVLVASGFNGNGIMFGTISARIIADAILGKKNRYAGLFNPSRIKPVAGFSEFVKENADVVYHFIADRVSSEAIKTLKSIKHDTGEVVDYQGEKLAIYKSKTGKIHALSPVCTHAKCIVNFNPAEKSWDCPCHGGRFDINGNVLTGPPRHNLKKVDIT